MVGSTIKRFRKRLPLLASNQCFHPNQHTSQIISKAIKPRRSQCHRKWMDATTVLAFDPCNGRTLVLFSKNAHQQPGQGKPCIRRSPGSFGPGTWLRHVFNGQRLHAFRRFGLGEPDCFILKCVGAIESSRPTPSIPAPGFHGGRT